MFNVICRFPREFWNGYKYVNKTHHVKQRTNRIALYGEVADIVDAFIVNKGHANGSEVHMINENGVILVFNHESKLFITMLNARPSQIKRYYEDGSKMNEYVKSAIRIAHMNNVMNHYNKE